MYDYWLFGIKQPTNVAHSAHLPQPAVPGHTLTFEAIGDTYRVLASKEGHAGTYGVLLLEIVNSPRRFELTDADKEFLRQCGISSGDIQDADPGS